MNYGKWGCSLQKDKQEDGEMESVGVDGVVALLGLLFTPSGLEQYAVGHRVANRLSSPATEGNCQEEHQKTNPPFPLCPAVYQRFKDTNNGWFDFNNAADKDLSKNTQLWQTTQLIQKPV